MQVFLNFIEPFIYGCILGFVWYPTLKLSRKIWAEAKKAQHEWSNPRGKSR